MGRELYLAALCLVFRAASSFVASPRVVQMAAAAGSRVDQSKLQQALSTSKKAARAAGAHLLEGVGAAIKKTKFNTRDLLTEIDGECQTIIEKVFEEDFPDHTLLGEESVPPGAEASTKALEEALKNEWVVIVDPVDGTTNFVQQMPLSVVSIGVAYRGELVVGVIYDPYRDELFSTFRGGGAFMNDKQIKVGKEDTLDTATVSAGAPPSLLSLGPSLRGINALAPHVRTVRLLGSAALMLAWVACGRLTVYFEPDLNSWDIAAGALLVQEAGGKMTDLDGSDFSVSTRAILASNGLVHQGVQEKLAAADCLRPDTTPRV